ncbi:MAG: dTDP-4-dehydrorhamnose reductase [Ignavibacteria bacterium]|nr:dTDP-4-dehydrorhamnose reductase [Ignavibacteria bacterium]
MTPKRVLVVGSNGLLGQRLTDLLVRGTDYKILLCSLAEKPVRDMTSTEYRQMDITSKKQVKRVVFGFEPDVIVNAAGMTNVDACETERERAWRTNVEGVENLVEAARRNNAKIFHVSTDYIFDGKAGPYVETDRPEPLGYYGKTKLAAENVLRASGLEFFIARTIVLYGYAVHVRPNFALWLIQNLEKKSSVRIVDDQMGNPTFADDLAYGLLKAIELGKSGIFNIAGRDIMSRHEFALRVAKVFEFDPTLITPIKTQDLDQPAMRPLQSGLITLKAEIELGYKPSTVEQGLAILKSQISMTMRRMADSAPVPGGTQGRHLRR